jgi:hypothetical protein
MSAIQKAICIAVGLYIGKYYPQYVPLPEINKNNINKLLNKLEEMTKNNK